MSSLLKYLLLVASAVLMIAILFLYPLGFSLVSVSTAPGQPFTLDHFCKVYAFYASDVFSSLIIVLVSVALLALIAITLSTVIALSPRRPAVRLPGFLYRLSLFILFVVVVQMMHTLLAKNDLMNNALMAVDLAAPLEMLPWLGWKGIVIASVWRQLAFIMLSICGAMAALELSQILAACNFGASRPWILFNTMLPQVLSTVDVALVPSTVIMMSVLSVPLMIGVGTPMMLTVDMAFRVNPCGDYVVASVLGVVLLAICGVLSWFYPRHSLQQKGGES